MKLNSEQVTRTLSQFEAQVIPDTHPAVPQLNSVFGDHTFFLNSSGLNVLEPAGTSDREADAGQIVNIANWSDDTQTSLKLHDPEPTGVVVMLAAHH